MKKSYYFSHDFNARNDPKMMQLAMSCGMEGVGAYWCIVEILYEQGGRIAFDALDGIAFQLRIDRSIIDRIIEVGLLNKDRWGVYSISAKRRIEEMNERSRRLSESGKRGAEKRKMNSQALATLSQTDSQAIATLSQTDSQALANKINKNKINKNKFSFFVNKENNKETNEQKDEFFQILFFRNIKDPDKEVERFIDYYNTNGWTLRGDKTINDKQAICGKWKPSQQGQRFETSVLDALRAIFCDEACAEVLRTIKEAKRLKTDEKTQMLAISVSDRELFDKWLVPHMDEVTAKIKEHGFDKIGVRQV